VEAHLSGCWPCRARKQELENAILDFCRFHRDRLDPLAADAAGPRALLKARLAEAASLQATVPAKTPAPPLHILRYGFSLAAILAIAVLSLRHGSPPSGVSLPEPSLTPGAIATVNREQVCDSAQPKNRVVPRSLARRVFDEYGIRSSEPRGYEVDYLITPALGGADDIRNLWPQSYSATTWNAQVKDALEDHLRDLVCSGRLDLATAQRDISSDWIAAYRKYFHTDRPIDRTR
jgi:hypothetical protein